MTLSIKTWYENTIEETLKQNIHNIPDADTETQDSSELFDSKQNFTETPFFCDEILSDNYRNIPLINLPITTTTMEQLPLLPVVENSKLLSKIQKSTKTIEPANLDNEFFNTMNPSDESSNDDNNADQDDKIREKKKITCQFCGTQYSRRNTWMSHIKKKHPEEYVAVKEGSLGTPERQKIKFGKYDDRLKCVKCDCVFRQVDTLYNHQKKYHFEYQQTVSKLGRGPKRKKLEYLDSDNSDDETDETGKNALRRYHIKCQMCTHLYFTQNELDDHQSKWHPEYYQLKKASKEAFLEKLKCKICGDQLATQRSFKNHMLCHTGEYPFKCSECGSGFLDAYKLKRHMFKHNGNYPFRCDICDKGFRDWGRYMRHCKPLHPEIYEEALLQKKTQTKFKPNGEINTDYKNWGGYN